jgi:hypothetical protein
MYRRKLRKEFLGEFGGADHQPSVRNQRLMELLDDLAGPLGRKIDHDVPAEDDIHRGRIVRQGRVDVFGKVQIGEIDHRPYFRGE